MGPCVRYGLACLKPEIMRRDQHSPANVRLIPTSGQNRARYGAPSVGDNSEGADRTYSSGVVFVVVVVYAVVSEVAVSRHVRCYLAGRPVIVIVGNSLVSEIAKSGD